MCRQGRSTTWAATGAVLGEQRDLERLVEAALKSFGGTVLALAEAPRERGCVPVTRADRGLLEQAVGRARKVIGGDDVPDVADHFVAADALDQSIGARRGEGLPRMRRKRFSADIADAAPQLVQTVIGGGALLVDEVQQPRESGVLGARGAAGRVLVRRG